MPAQPKSRKNTKATPVTTTKSVSGKLAKSSSQKVTKSTARKTTKSSTRKVSSSRPKKQPTEVVRPEYGMIEGPLTWKQARNLLDLSRSQFANELEYLVFTKFPFNSWHADLESHRHYVRSSQKSSGDASEKDDECRVLGLMLGQALKGFKNLGAITLDFSTPKSRPTSGLSSRSEPFAHALKQIERPLLLTVFYERGVFRLTWSGNKKNMDEISIENCQPSDVPYWLEGYYLTERYPKIFRGGCLTLVEPIILDPCVEILELESVIEKRPARLQHAIGHALVQGLRELSIVRCKTANKTADWIPLLQDLLACGRLESLRFQQVGGVRFDWDGDGKLDDGSKVPQMVEQIGMKATLEKMISAYCNIYA